MKICAAKPKSSFSLVCKTLHSRALSPRCPWSQMSAVRKVSSGFLKARFLTCPCLFCLCQAWHNNSKASESLPPEQATARRRGAPRGKTFSKDRAKDCARISAGREEESWLEQPRLCFGFLFSIAFRLAMFLEDQESPQPFSRKADLASSIMSASFSENLFWNSRKTRQACSPFFSFASV